MSEIISDATPLITFARIGQLSLLQKMVGTLVIPTAVADEISAYTQDRPGVIDLQQQQWGEIIAVKPLLEAMTQQGIHFNKKFIEAVLQMVEED